MDKVLRVAVPIDVALHLLKGVLLHFVVLTTSIRNEACSMVRGLENSADAKEIENYHHESYQ